MQTTLPNLKLRNFAGPSDYAKIAEVVNACNDQSSELFADTEETVANRYTNFVNCDPYRDMIIADVDGEMVGYSRCDWDEQPEAGRIYHFSLIVKPLWRGKGVAELLMEWMISVIHQKATNDAGCQQAFWQCYESATDTENILLLEQAGFQPYRQFQGLVRSIKGSLPPAEFPTGIELRPATPDHYRAIWQAWNEVTQDRIGYSLVNDAHYQAWLNDAVYFQPEFWQIAWDTTTNQIAGFSLNSVEKVENERFKRKRAQMDIGVRRPWRRHGLAKALVLQTLHTFQSIGMTEATINIEASTEGWQKSLLQQNHFMLDWSLTEYRKPIRIHKPPTGWFVAGDHPENYQMGIDTTVKHSGNASGHIKFIAETAKGFGTLMQMFQAGEYRGKRLRLSAWMKTEDADSAHVWMRLDGMKSMLGFDNMDNRAVKGTSDWSKYELTLDVPEETIFIAFGAFIIGKGQAWVDDYCLEVVGKDVPTTNLLTPEQMQEEEELKGRTDYPQQALNLNFEEHLNIPAG